MTDNDTDDVLDTRQRDAINHLPRDIQPERDLWPDIAAHIAPRHRRMRYWPIAAAIGVAVLVGIGLFGERLNRPVAPKAPVAVTAARPAGPVAIPDTPRAMALAASLRSTTGIDPKTRAVLLTNLAIIENALDNIQRAMQQDPGNPALQRLLYQTYTSEAALMTTVQRVRLQTPAGVAV